MAGAFNGGDFRRHLLLNLAIGHGVAASATPPRGLRQPEQGFHGFADRLEFFGNFQHDLHLGVSSIAWASLTPAMPWLCPRRNQLASPPPLIAQNRSHTLSERSVQRLLRAWLSLTQFESLFYFEESRTHYAPSQICFPGMLPVIEFP